VLGQLCRRHALVAMAAYAVTYLVTIGLLVVTPHIGTDHVSYSASRSAAIWELWPIWRVARRRGRLAWTFLAVIDGLVGHCPAVRRGWPVGADHRGCLPHSDPVGSAAEPRRPSSSRRCAHRPSVVAQQRAQLMAPSFAGSG
jgi:hypothetical protein